MNEKRKNLNLVEDYELTLLEGINTAFTIEDVLSNSLYSHGMVSEHNCDLEKTHLTELANRVSTVLSFQPSEKELELLPDGYDITEDKYLALLEIISQYIKAREVVLKKVAEGIELEKDCFTVAAMKVAQEKFH